MSGFDYFANDVEEAVDGASQGAGMLRNAWQVALSASSRRIAAMTQELPDDPSGGFGNVPALLPTQLRPDLARSVPSCAFVVDAPDRLEGFGVAFGPVEGFSGIAGGGVRISGRRSDRQDAADRLDSAGLAMLFDERDHLRNGRSSSAWAKQADTFFRISLASRAPAP